MDGFLNIDKPARAGSRDVTSRIAHALSPAKVGHVGTLDPIATGVLVVCVGRATRLTDILHTRPKVYEARFLWNRRSDTEDITGTVEQIDHPTISAAAVRHTLPRFTGEITQVPPAFSAKRIKGRRAYDLARAGREVELPPKQVLVHELELVDADETSFSLRIACGSGVYVRSLGRDIAAACGGSAVMDQLRRTQVGPFRVEESVSFDAASEAPASLLVPAQTAVEHLPQVSVQADELRGVLDGKRLTRSDTPDGSVALIDEQGLVGIGEAAEGLVKPRTILRSRD